MEAEIITTALETIASAGLSETLEMRFDASPGTVSVVPSSANLQDRTIDVVWYGGASVARVNQRTGDPYKLRLDMSGANLGRLNAGAPVFDNHMSGSDMGSIRAGTVGTKAQIGVVKKAWAQGSTGRATLKFAQDPQADSVWNKITDGIIQNLSFGTWIYGMEPDESVGPKGYLPNDEDQEGPQNFVATSWEPFEVSPVCIPADYSTAFLSAEVTPQAISLPPQTVAMNTTETPAQQETMRASAREETQPMAENLTQAPGSEARPEINQEALRAEGIKAERERAQSIQLSAKPFAAQLGEEFTTSLISEGLSVEASRARILEKLAKDANVTVTRSEVAVTITRDNNDSRRENMEAALLYRFDPRKYSANADKARDYAGLSLSEMAKECLQAAGIKTKGMSKQQIASIALNNADAAQYFDGSRASTSDFPNILANVANKTMRQAYEAFPSTFKPFCRQVTASDFKPINRVQLSDVVALPGLNENGEYHRTTPSDSKETYSLATYGEVISISRKVIINDDLQAFTRIPMLLGVAAARMEADTVWAIFTGNPTMGDSLAVFHTSHSNLLSGGGSALAQSGLASARASMRLQTGPKGTILNLTPKYLIVPAALENTAEQLVAPINIASSDVTKVVPTWIRSLNPIVEPRLDASSTTGWFLVADPSMIDTIEYCYLEGQEGVYTETRQGFEVDGIEIKARMDFAAATTEYRGLQENAGV